jgi:hypothetical protein
MLGILAKKICPKKKKSNLSINQCGKKGGGGYYIPARFRTISIGYLKINRIKKSPQLGWVKKLQRIIGFQTVRGGYFFFFKTRLTNTEITKNINLDTRLDPQPALLQFLILGHLPYKYITLSKPCQIFAAEDLDKWTNGIWVSGP